MFMRSLRTIDCQLREFAQDHRMRIVVLPGDGIGPEISEAALSVLNAVNSAFGLGLQFETHQIGLVRLKAEGSTFPDSVLKAAREADGIILGPVSHSDYP